MEFIIQSGALKKKKSSVHDSLSSVTTARTFEIVLARHENNIVITIESCTTSNYSKFFFLKKNGSKTQNAVKINLKKKLKY